MITVNKAIICDDIRVEVGGKVMLIGVYPANDIAVPSFPTDIILSSYVEVNSTKDRLCNGTTIVEDEAGHKILEIPMRFVVTANRTIPLFGGASFHVDKPGIFKLIWKIDGEEDVDVCRVTIGSPRYVAPASGGFVPSV